MGYIYTWIIFILYIFVIFNMIQASLGEIQLFSSMLFSICLRIIILSLTCCCSCLLCCYCDKSLSWRTSCVCLFLLVTSLRTICTPVFVCYFISLYLLFYLSIISSENLVTTINFWLLFLFFLILDNIGELLLAKSLRHLLVKVLSGYEIVCSTYLGSTSVCFAN